MARRDYAAAATLQALLNEDTVDAEATQERVSKRPDSGEQILNLMKNIIHNKSIKAFIRCLGCTGQELCHCE